MGSRQDWDLAVYRQLYPAREDAMVSMKERLAKSRRGRVPGCNGKLRYSTIHKYFILLSTILKRHQKPIQTDVMEAAHS